MLLESHKARAVTGKARSFSSLAIFNNKGSVTKQSYLKLRYVLMHNRKLFLLNQVQNSVQLRVGMGWDLALTKKVFWAFFPRGPWWKCLHVWPHQSFITYSDPSRKILTWSFLVPRNRSQIHSNVLITCQFPLIHYSLYLFPFHICVVLGLWVRELREFPAINGRTVFLGRIWLNPTMKLYGKSLRGIYHGWR